MPAQPHLPAGSQGPQNSVQSTGSQNPGVWHLGAAGASGTDPCGRIQQQTRHSLCLHSHQQHPPPLPDPCPLLQGRTQGSGSPWGLPAQPEAAQLVPSITPGSPVKPGMCPFQGNTDLSKGTACMVSRVGSAPAEERGEIHNLTAQLGLSALPAKSSREHWLDRRRLGRKQVLSTQHPPVPWHVVNQPWGGTEGLKLPPEHPPHPPGTQRRLLPTCRVSPEPNTLPVPYKHPALGRA